MDYERFRGLHAGATGTRERISSQQRENLMKVLCDLRPRRVSHGDCINADAEVHWICRSLAIPVNIRPPLDAKFRAFCPPGLHDTLFPEKSYLARDFDIVSESCFLIAIPKGERPASKIGSGTWTTVGYAEAAGMGTIILYPDGRVEVDGNPVVR